LSWLYRRCPTFISRRPKPLQNRRIQVLDEKTSSTLTP
jgi:hypothetical protein